MPVRGGARFRQLINQQKTASEAKGVAVGFFSSARYPDGTLVASVAAWNEYGTNASSRRPFDIPARPFMRPTIAEEMQNVRALLRARANPRTMTVTRADASAIGAYLAGKIQTKITTLREPPNAPSTVELKGSSNPLIDSGFMRTAVSFEVL